MRLRGGRILLGGNEIILSNLLISFLFKGVFNQLYETDTIISDHFIANQDAFFIIQIGFDRKRYFSQVERSFRSIGDILGNLGGGIKIVVLIGFIIVTPFAQLQFQRVMLNEVFNFESNKQQQQEESSKNIEVSIQGLKDNQHSKNCGANSQGIKQSSQVLTEQCSMRKDHRLSIGEPITSPPNIQNIEETPQQKSKKPINFFSDYIKETILSRSQAHISIDDTQTQTQQINNNTSNQNQQIMISRKDSEQQKKKELEQKRDDEMFEKYFKTTYNPLKLTFFQQLFYFLWPFGKYKRTKSKIQYSIEKLNHHLDSIYIVKKLLEVDKLKMLLLDEHQIKLLEFLPKPTIDLSQAKSRKQDSQNIALPDNLQEQNINILYQDTRNELTKATEAFQALNQIKQKSSLSRVDRKLIHLLDPKIVNYFHFPDQEDIIAEEQFQATNTPKISFPNLKLPKNSYSLLSPSLLHISDKPRSATLINQLSPLMGPSFKYDSMSSKNCNSKQKKGKKFSTFINPNKLDFNHKLQKKESVNGDISVGQTQTSLSQFYKPIVFKNDLRILINDDFKSNNFQEKKKIKRTKSIDSSVCELNSHEDNNSTPDVKFRFTQSQVNSNDEDVINNNLIIKQLQQSFEPNIQDQDKIISSKDYIEQIQYDQFQQCPQENNTNKKRYKKQYPFQQQDLEKEKILKAYDKRKMFSNSRTQSVISLNESVANESIDHLNLNRLNSNFITQNKFSSTSIEMVIILLYYKVIYLSIKNHESYETDSRKCEVLFHIKH